MKDVKNIFLILLKNKKFKDLKILLDKMNEIDIAELINEFNIENGIKIFRLLNTTKASDVFVSLNTERQTDILNTINDKELSQIVEDLFIDDVVDIIEELPADLVTRILKNSSDETRNTINQYLKYDKDSAGSIMTPEYIKLVPHMTVEEALQFIKKNAINSETIYTCFITDDTQQLIGVITIKDLLLSENDTKIKDIMNDNPIYATTNQKREEVADIINKYGFLGLPVVDHDKKLLGIVTLDDSIDVLEEETTEDFEIMAAMSPSEKPYLETTALTLAKNRVVWLVILMISDMLCGSILRNYEAAFQTYPLLVSFIPMLTDTGGNSGTQSSTMIIRGIAIGEIGLKDVFKVVFKELKVGLMVGFILSFINLLRLSIMYPDKTAINLTVIFSIYIIVIVSKVIGSALPLLAKALKMDPALMAAPLITTLVDALGLIVYFKIATYLLANI